MSRNGFLSNYSTVGTTRIDRATGLINPVVPIANGNATAGIDILSASRNTQRADPSMLAGPVDGGRYGSVLPGLLVGRSPMAVPSVIHYYNMLRRQRLIREALLIQQMEDASLFASPGNGRRLPLPPMDTNLLFSGPNLGKSSGEGKGAS